jgi:TRAP-type transport system periplasmic protein
MKKKMFILFLATMMILSLGLVGCGEDNTDPDNGGNQGDYLEGLPNLSIVLAHDVSPDIQNVDHAAALAFKDYLEKASAGKIKVEISPAAALGDMESLQEQNMDGIIEVITGTTEGTLALVYPDIQAISIPYLFNSVDHALEVFEGPFGQKMFKDMQDKTNMKVVGVWDNGGFRSFTNNKREIRTPDDMKGLTIRVMQSPVFIELVKNLGANPIPVAWTELYSALETGVADGQENSVPTIIMGSLHEVQSYLTLSEHVFSAMFMIVNNDWYEGLPKEYQLIVDEAGRQAVHAATRTSRVRNELGLAIVAAQNTQIYQPTREELNLFKQAVQEPVLAHIRTEVDSALVDELLAESEKTAKRMGY